MAMCIVVVCGWSHNSKIGNILLDKPQKIWNSTSARLQRLAILNKSFAFCKKESCPYYLYNINTINSKNQLKSSIYPEKVYIAFDESCNLKCKSCRNHHYNASKKEQRINDRISNRIIKSGWGNKSKYLTIAGQGEAMYSKTYLDMIFKSKITQRYDINIHSNGTLLDKEKIDKLCEIYKILRVYISVDAASEEVYKKVRGGNFKKLYSNLEYIGMLRKKKIINHFVLFFVIQKDNYMEIPKFLEMSKKLGVDYIEFSKISNWGTYTNEEFEKNISMFDKNNNLKAELKLILSDKLYKKNNSYNFSNINSLLS